MPCVLRLRQCERLGVSIHPYRPLTKTFRALDVVARTRYESIGGQHFIVAAIPGAHAPLARLSEKKAGTDQTQMRAAWHNAQHRSTTQKRRDSNTQGAGAAR